MNERVIMPGGVGTTERKKNAGRMRRKMEDYTPLPPLQKKKRPI